MEDIFWGYIMTSGNLRMHMAEKEKGTGSGLNVRKHVLSVL
jgi:hypothetical protein